MNRNLQYDGKFVAVHKIAKGEDLSKIANAYGLSNWQPIWNFNTKVNRIYAINDPDVIKAGESLLIPRSPAGYDELIRKFRQLKTEMYQVGIREAGRLESLQYKYKADTIVIDFFADAATTFATFALKAGKAAQAAKYAEQTMGQGKVAAQYLARQEAEKLTMWIGEQSVGAFAKSADVVHNKVTGKPTEVGAKTHKYATTAKKTMEAIRGYSMKGGKSVLDVTDILLDYLSPTQLANLYIYITTGETAEDTFSKQANGVRNNVEKSVRQLDVKLNKYHLEKQAVYQKPA